MQGIDGYGTGLALGMDVRVHERVCNSCYVHQLEQFIKIPYIGHRKGKGCLISLSGEPLSRFNNRTQKKNSALPKGIGEPLSLYESNLQAFGIHCVDY